MANLGMAELLVILAIVLLVFGAGRLPQLGEGIGKAIRNLKRGLNTDDDIDVQAGGQAGSAKAVPPAAGQSARSEIADADVVDRKG